jgi:hypothetical protein
MADDDDKTLAGNVTTTEGDLRISHWGRDTDQRLPLPWIGDVNTTGNSEFESHFCSLDASSTVWAGSIAFLGITNMSAVSL